MTFCAGFRLGPGGGGHSAAHIECESECEQQQSLHGAGEDEGEISEEFSGDRRRAGRPAGEAKMTDRVIE